MPDSRNLDRFGDSRCVEAGRYERLLLISGPDPELAPGSVVVAEVAGITEDELADHHALQQRFGDLLRDGTIEVDEAALDDLATTATDELRTVLTTPGLPAAWLAGTSTAGGEPATSTSRLPNGTSSTAGSNWSNGRPPTTRPSSSSNRAPDERRC